MSLTKMIRKSPMFSAMDRMEDELYARNDVVHPVEDSPERFEIVREKIKRGGDGPPSRLAFIMIPTLMGIIESLKSLENNPEKPRTQAEKGLLDEVRSLAFNLGVSSIGYTKVSPAWVFRNKAIKYKNAIVFAMEMDKPSIDTAPSLACMKTVMETYRDQGRIANKIASLLRNRGFGAHAGHPLMGLALYPPMAQSAGLGWIGLNGIIITPEHGPRVRLAAVFTSIENLPFADENEHGWIEGYCNSCRVCIKECPPNALYGEPVLHDSGRLTYVENELCFPYFDDYYGCSVCVKVCPFNHVAYEKLRDLRTHQ
ncbi:MAG: epoxyqueuosine reductase [Anaerolineaceae bacterium]|nr:MAG: epoxyqueuosine reductase [Anaerolineaceae bacterium]